MSKKTRIDIMADTAAEMCGGDEEMLKEIAEPLRKIQKLGNDISKGYADIMKEHSVNKNVIVAFTVRFFQAVLDDIFDELQEHFKEETQVEEILNKDPKLQGN